MIAVIPGHDRDLLEELEADSPGETVLWDSQPLPPWQEELYQTFWRLHTERPMGEWGMGPIPASKIDDRLDREGYRDPEQRDEAQWLLSVLDSAYLRWSTERREQIQREAEQKAKRT